MQSQVYHTGLISEEIMVINFKFLSFHNYHLCPVDNFNVDGYNGSTSFYPKYGAQGDRPPGSYMVVVRETSNTNYAFIAVDAALNPGPIRAMNFIGELDRKNLKKLEEYQTVIEQLQVNGSFWFGHYPTSSIMMSRYLRSLASKSIAYFCGHLHTIFGLVPQMYSPHHSGMLELELADWKDNRMCLYHFSTILLDFL